MNRNVLIGAAVGVGAILLVPGVAAAVARASKPLVRSTMKTGASGMDTLRRAGAEVYEHLEDVAAEVRAEVREARRAEAEAAGSSAAGPDGG